MSAQAILKDAADCGVRISLNGDNLAFKATVRPPPELLANLKTHKAEIVALLRNEAACSPEPDQVELEERKAMAMDSVPEPYLDRWARLQLRQPHGVAEARWRQAVNDAGLFLDRWGTRASELRWAPGNLFDAPHDGKPGGLAWCLEKHRVIHLGDEFAVMNDYRAFDRTTGRVV